MKDLGQELNELGIDIDSIQDAGFLKYHSVLEKWSRRVRLVGDTRRDLVALRHFADSLTVLPFLTPLREGNVVVDIGSGAGFPGIPLALRRQDLGFVLVESDYRKAAFLVAALSEVGMTNVKVLDKRALGDPESDGIVLADLVVSRAVMDVKRWVPFGKRYLKYGGYLVAMMGANAPDDEELHVIGAAEGLQLVSIWRRDLLEMGKRTISAWAIG